MTTQSPVRAAMKIEHIAVTGAPLFLKRHGKLFDALRTYYSSIEIVPSGDIYDTSVTGMAQKVFHRLATLADPEVAYGRLHKTRAAFEAKSRQTEQKVASLRVRPDIVFHVFGMFCPTLRPDAVPYVMLLDYTTALAEHNWKSWAPFKNATMRARWMVCERVAFGNARHLFAMSNVVKRSLILDYGIQEAKITVVGSAGDSPMYKGEKRFTGRSLLFNGSFWDRKGGDIVLRAFEIIRAVNPEARLTIVGKKLLTDPPGVASLGFVNSRVQMEELFLATDIVVAPARCDPFPTFVIEAMNYGVPGVVSGHDGMPEIVDHGRCGIVLSELTAETLAEQCITLLDDRDRLVSLSEAARDRVATKFNWDAIAATIRRVMGAL